MAIDLFCGLGGWTEGFLSEGWDVVGFDIERHVYGDQRYPAQLVQADVLNLWGSQFAGADCIVASPPCQTYSYMAMPWSRAKTLAAWYREIELRQLALNALFNSCFRIQREACEAAGRHIPMVVENVKGAQPWVGRAKANFGSFYFWGDVAMVGGQVVAGRPQFGQTVNAARRRGGKVDGFNFHQFEKTGQPGGSFQSAAVKTTGHANRRDGFDHTRQLTNQAESDAVKVGGLNWSGHGEPGYKPQGFNVVAAQRYRTKQEGSGPAWFDSGLCKKSSRSDSRKAASAQIARIPFPLASYIARQFRPALPA